jgi:hypothetical protein
MNEYLDNLQKIEGFLLDLSNERNRVVLESLSLLVDEKKLLEASMSFQYSAVESVIQGAATPITDDGLRAASALACYTFDMLLCGWTSLTRGFYAAAFHFVRSIDQATVTEVAVTIDPNIARKFWEDRLDDGDAAKALQIAIEKEDPDFGKEWGKRRLYLRNLFHKFMHPSRTAVSPSIIIATDVQSAMPTIGGMFIEKQCQRIGRLYADFAFKAAVDASQAFKTVLPPKGKLKQSFDELVRWGRPLTDSWEKEMGF